MKSRKIEQIYCQKLKFNDDTELLLEKDSIVVFTGANNSGKSQVLKEIERCMHGNNREGIIVKDYEVKYIRYVNETFGTCEYIVTNKETYKYVDDVKKQINAWEECELDGEHLKDVINRLSTERRLNSSDAMSRLHDVGHHPIYKLHEDEPLCQKISDYFNDAFGVDLVLNPGEMNTIPLHVGKGPDKTKYTMDKRTEYCNEVKKLPKLQEQGDGMRSFAGVLLNSFTSNYSVNLIDEPEAFLHPPQARILGRMLVENNPADRQLFIATHSEDFLQGLLDANYKNLTIIRISRENDANRMNVLKNEKIKELWKNSIMRYTNILSGLFHEKVIICESDYDCLFYHALINAVYEKQSKIAPDILFTHCGGKGRMKDIVSALKVVNVPVVSICDFDLLNEKRTFKDLASAFNIDWKSSLEDDMKIIYDGMNARNSKGYDAWAEIKTIGSAGFKGAEPAAYEKVEAECKNAGLFVVPVGELECFDKTVSKEKKDWVYYMLENYDLATYSKLEGARNFISEVLNFVIK